MSELAAVVGNDADVKYFKVTQIKLFPVEFPQLMPKQNISEVYISKWEEFGISRDGSHAKLAYDWYGSWTTLYNLFSDALLCFHLEGTSLATSTPSFASVSQDKQQPLNLLKQHHKYKDENSSSTGFVPRRIYKMQSTWYDAVRQRYGLPLDSRHLYVKTDWEYFAASVSSPRVRNEIIESHALWVNETSTGMASPFSL